MHTECFDLLEYLAGTFTAPQVCADYLDHTSAQLTRFARDLRKPIGAACGQHEIESLLR
jgi:hypothetical protein